MQRQELGYSTYIKKEGGPIYPLQGLSSHQDCSSPYVWAVPDTVSRVTHQRCCTRNNTQWLLAAASHKVLTVRIKKLLFLLYLNPTCMHVQLVS